VAPAEIFGLLNVNKPPGPTSHDVVALVRRGTRVRKVGHAGTLDPTASGVLILCLGPATRLSEYAMHSPKRYRAEVRLGVSTNTYDTEGEVTAERPLTGLTTDRIEAALEAFRGEIAQVPPMYSAIKQGGKRLYDLARAGKEVTRPPRQVTIYDLRLLEAALPDVTLDVACSPGTYIRSLAHDLGEALGVGAHLTGLVRTASGSFRVEDAVPLEDLRTAIAADDWRRYLLPPGQALADWSRLDLSADQAVRLLNGGAFRAQPDAAGRARAYAPEGRLLALVEVRKGEWWPFKVFPPEGESG